VVERDVGDDGEERIDYICCVEASAHADFKDRQIDFCLGKIDEGQGSKNLEEAGVLREATLLHELLGADPQKVSALRQKQTQSPAKLIEERALGQASAARRAADLALDLADQPVPMSEDYLAKIVDELVQNAFKFSDPGTRVRVTLSGLPNGVMLSVTDQGRGFSTEDITRVGAYMQFDRKIQEQQGLGLGLVIAKRLTELHGGTLSIQSERGNSTMVTVKLPKAALR